MTKFYVGKKSVIEAINKNSLSEIHYKNFFPEISIAKKKNIKLIKHDNDDFFLKFNSNHQFVVGIQNNIKSNIFESLEEFCNELNIKENNNKLIVILDSIQDPGNFGAICRSCESFSVDGIIIKKNNQVDVNDVVIKTSLGSANNIPILKVANLSTTIEKLKKDGFWVIATGLNEKAVDLQKTKLDFQKTCLIMGNENNGVSQLLLKNSDMVVKIPMTGNVQSLNVSVSTGILLFWLSINKKIKG